MIEELQNNITKARATTIVTIGEILGDRTLPQDIIDDVYNKVIDIIHDIDIPYFPTKDKKIQSTAETIKPLHLYTQLVTAGRRGVALFYLLDQYMCSYRVDAIDVIDRRTY